MTTANARERLLELLADRALVGLRPAEELELISLIAMFPDAQALASEIDTAAAATAIASVAGRLEAMPPRLFARVEAEALAQAPRVAPGVPAHAVRALESARHDPTRTIAMPDRPVDQVVVLPAGSPVQPRPTAPISPIARGRAFGALGWLAAAACLLLAIGTWYYRPRTKIVTVMTPSSATSAPTPPSPPPSVEREKLLARTGTSTLPWAATKDPAARTASGDVVWNATEQRGFMRFRGLAKNDPRNTQYQLWIFDKTRDEKYPIDGGVFDVDDESGDVIVPITAKLRVVEASLFAITIEKPGGVVVSKRERIVVTAKPAG